MLVTNWSSRLDGSQEVQGSSWGPGSYLQVDKLLTAHSTELGFRGNGKSHYERRKSRGGDYTAVK